MRWAWPVRDLWRVAALAVAIAMAPVVSAHAADDDLAKLKSLQDAAEALADKSDYAGAVPLALEAAKLANEVYGGDHIETAAHLHRLGRDLRWVAKYDEARGVLEHTLAIRRTADPASLDTADTLNELGWIELKTSNLQEAERKFQEALEIKRRVLGPDGLENAWAVEGLAETYVLMSKFVDAETFAIEAFRIEALHFPPGHKQLIKAKTTIAITQHRLGKLAEAEKGLDEALAARRASPDALPLDIANALNLVAIVNHEKGSFYVAEKQANEGLQLLEQAGASGDATYFQIQSLLSKIYASTDRYAEAEATAIKVRDAYGKVAGLNARTLIDSYNSLSVIYTGENRYAEAEQSLKKGIALAEQIYGENSIDVSALLENLSFLYAKINRPDEALKLFDRILRIRSAVLPADHMLVGAARTYRAKVLNRLARYAEAEQDAGQALRMIERAYGPSHILALNTRLELAAALKNQGKLDEAIRHYQDMIEIVTAGIGPGAYILVSIYRDLGLAFKEADRLDEAEQAVKAALARNRQDDEIPKAQSLKVLADIHVQQRKWDDALESYRSASAIFVRSFVAASAGGGTRQYEGSNWLRSTARGHVEVLLKMAELAPEKSDGFAKEGFELSQWLVRSSAASSAIGQARARLAAGNAELVEKARERQDAADRWSNLETSVSRSLELPIEQRNEQELASQRGELAKLEARLSDLDKRLAEAFPAFAELAGSRAVPADELQARWIGADEALVSFAVVGDRIVVWVVTRDTVHWHTSTGLATLNRLTWQLRCRLDASFGLDPEHWPFVTPAEGSETVAGETPEQSCRRWSKSGFDVAEAYELYRFLLGPADALIEKKQLVIAASGPVLRVPFNALVASPLPAGTAASTGAERFRKADWLGTRNAITMIPSVSSLKALRVAAKAERARRPMIAFANPTLDGTNGSAAKEIRRRIAASYQNCGVPPSPEESLLETAEAFRTSSLGATSGIDAAVDTAAAVRTLQPIPGTARLACGLANGPQFSGSTVWLGRSATEARVRALSDTGELAANRVVHFATHGMRAGQIAGMNEPGLILTPGEGPVGADDDGYLGVSEITTLKLNADWVILSACETAAGEKGGEALSGLARAFFYAGAQALLVTNWAVYEEAAINLVSAATQHMIDDQVGRAEALRHAMSDVVATGSERQVNPVYWAPFVIVGEGSVPRS